MKIDEERQGERDELYIKLYLAYLETSSQSGPLRLESRNTASISDLIFKRAKVSWRGHRFPPKLILSPSSPPSLPFSSPEFVASTSIPTTSPPLTPSCAASSGGAAAVTAIAGLLLWVEISNTLESPSCIQLQRYVPMQLQLEGEKRIIRIQGEYSMAFYGHGVLEVNVFFYFLGGISLSISSQKSRGKGKKKKIGIN